MNKKVISLVLTAALAFSVAVPVASAANTTATVNVDQNVGDYTYFNSNYHNITTETYAKTTISADEGNTVKMGAFDYQNPDKVKNIVLDKTVKGMCSFGVHTEGRQQDFEQKKRYKYFGLSTEFKITSEETSLDLFRLKNRKTNTTFSTTMINGTEITYADGSTSSIELDTWYTYLVYYNVNTDEVEMYLDGEPVAKSSFESDRLDDVVTSIESETGSAELLNYDITGYEKAMVNGVPEKTSVFVDSIEAENLLNQYTAAFHAYSGVYYADGEKLDMEPAPVYEEGEIYISLDDFNSALGVNAAFTNGVLSNGSESMNLSADMKISDGVELIPVQRACKLFSVKTYADGNGMVIADDETIVLENNDHWYDVYNDELVADGKFKGTAFEVSDVRMMNWYLLYERPTAEALEDTFNANTSNGEQHPRLIVNSDKIAEITALAESDGNYRTMVDGFISAAEAVMNEAVVSFDSIYAKDGYRTNTAAESFEARVKKLAFAYLLTEDTRYAERAMQDLIAVAEFPDFNYSHIIDSGVWSSGLAFGYDWLYNYMYNNGDTETIDKIADAIIKLEIEPVSRAYYAGLPGNASPIDAVEGGGLQSSNAFARWKSNYGSFVNSGMIVSALAVGERNPELCFDAIEKALRSYEYVLCGFETGEWLESPRYWYSMQSDIAYSAGSLISVMGTDYNLLSAPGMKEQSKNIVNYTSLNSRFSYGDDSDCMTRFFSLEPFSFFADYYDLPQLAAMRKIKLSPELRTQFGSNMMSADPSVLDIVYYMPEASISDLDAIPNVYVGEGTESFIVHEDFQNPNALFFAAAGGPTSFYHSHNDSGDFIFDLGGETWAYELGTSSYNIGSPTTRYASRTEGHNTLTINPGKANSQQAGSFAELVAHNSNDKGAYAVYDMTSLYSDAESVQRGFYIDDNYNNITVRDEMSFSSAVDGYWFMHTDADIEVVSDSLVKLTKNNKTLYMQISVEGASSYTVSDMDAVHLDSSIAPEGEEYNSDVRKVAINFNGSDVAVTVRMALTQGVINTTPIADRLFAGGGMEKVWSQDFEDCTTVDDAGFAEITTKESPESTSALIMESGLNKYFEMEMTNADSGSAIYSAGTVNVSELGIEDGADFTVSYDVKFNPYDEETGKSSTGKYVEYLFGLGDNPSGVKGYRCAYVTYREEGNNNYAPSVNEGCITNDNCEYPVSGVKSLYAGAWNNVQWVVHRTDSNGEPLSAADMYAELYINGEYSATVGIRNGEDMRRAVFAISLNEGVKYGKMAIDNIEIFKGSYDKQDTAKFAEVKLIDTDFSDMTASENGASDVSSTPMFIGASKLSVDGAEVIIETKKGVFGKGTDDNAVHWQRTSESSDTSLDTRLEFNNEYGELYESGDSLEISVDFAFDEKITPLCLTAQFIKEDGSLKKMVDFIKVSGDYIKILNDNHVFDLTPALIPGKWYNLRVVLTSGDGESTYNTVTAYLDGEVIVDGPTSTKPDGQAPVYIQNYELTDFASAVGTVEDEFDRIKGIDYLWVHFKNVASSAGKGMYFDNLEMTKYIGGALPKTTYTKLPVTSSVVPASYAQRGTVFTDTTATVNEVLNMFDMSRAKNIIVRDASGNVITDYSTTANGKYAEIKSNDNERYYVTMDGTNKTIAEISDASQTTLKVESNLSKTEVAKGAGRASGDKSILVESTDGNKGSATVNLFTTSTTYVDSTAYKPVTAEVSVMPLDNSKIEVQMYTNANTRNCLTSGHEYRMGITAAYFENGMIYGKNSSYPIMPYEAGKWYKIAVTSQPGSQTLEVRVNGEFAEETGNYTVRKYPTQFISQLKLIVHDNAVFDDIKIYNGKYIEDEIPYITSASEDAIIDDGKIYIPEETSISELTDYLDFTCGMPTGVYSDSTLSEQISELEDGCVLVIENDGIYKEYQIYLQKPEYETDCIYPTVEGNVYSAYAVPTDSDAKLIIAAYVDGTLDKVVFGTSEQGSSKVNVTAEVTEGSTVKVMLVNTKTMKPLSKAITYVNGVVQ